MPIVLEKELPEYKIFTGEGLFAIDSERAQCQKIRPLKIAILNLTPDYGATESRLMRLISNSPLQVKITLLNINSQEKPHTYSNFDDVYKNFTTIEAQKYDGMIVAGSPDENLPFNRITYRKELAYILDWTQSNVTSAMFVGWGAQTALNHFYGVKKNNLKDKCLGVFTHQRIRDGVTEPLMRGISDEFDMPHSHHSIIYAKDVMHIADLKILAYSKRAGASIIKSVDNRKVFVAGHMEYDRFAIKDEYERDKKCGTAKTPINYFVDKDLTDVRMNWASTASLFYLNWLNYYVYQATPYDINLIEAKT